jgi:hypothetical protein
MSQNLRSLIVFFLLAIAVVILVISTQPVYAQPGGDPCPFPPCNPDVPISGIEILLAAGGVLGVKRILGIIRKSKSQ